MSRKVLLIIGAVLVVGAVVVFFGDGSKDARPSTTSSGNEAAQNERVAESNIPEAGSASLPDLIRLGNNIQCDFSYTGIEMEGEMRGTMYIADRGEQFRGDFTMTQQGQTVETHIIRNNETAYTWSQTPFGSMAVEFAIENDEDIFDASNENFNYNQQFEYSCDRWNVDASKFIPPRDIEFTNMTDMMMEMEANAQVDTKSMQCAACEGIADAAAKAQCKAALGC